MCIPLNVYLQNQFEIRLRFAALLMPRLLLIQSLKLETKQNIVIDTSEGDKHFLAMLSAQFELCNVSH